MTNADIVQTATLVSEIRARLQRIEQTLAREVPRENAESLRSVSPLLKIQAVTADFFRVTLDRLVSSGKRQDDVYRRAVAMYLCRHLAAASYPEIGRMFNRHHTSVIHCVQLVEANPRFMETAEQIAEIMGRELPARIPPERVIPSVREGIGA